MALEAVLFLLPIKVIAPPVCSNRVFQSLKRHKIPACAAERGLACIFRLRRQNISASIERRIRARCPAAALGGAAAAASV
jgi:hypothetical protein